MVHLAIILALLSGKLIGSLFKSFGIGEFGPAPGILGILLPTVIVTADEDAGFVGQNVRGNYTRDDKVTVTDITATPIGAFAGTFAVQETVINAYESNKDDTWDVEVYFWITKN